MRILFPHRWLILALLIAAFAGRFLLTTSHFYTHDDMQVFRVNEYVQCLKDGQLPCRWSASLGKGYGYPLFNFYPPLIYLIPSLLHLIGLPIILSLNLMMFASFLLAAWGMYLLGTALAQSSSLGFLASALYTLYPFHAINVFVRGVYAENLAWSIFPMILYLIFEQSRRNIQSRPLPFLLAIIYLTHLIGAVIITPMIILWSLYFRSLTRLLTQILLGMGMASFFLLPALAEKSLVQTQSMINGYYSFTNHYVSFYQLFGQYRWSYDASLWSAAPDEMPYMVGHIHTALLGIAIGAIIFLAYRNSKKLILAGCMLSAASILLFLSHFKADFIWQIIPPLAYIQFPWRFIAWAALPLTLGITLLLSLLPNKLSYSLTLITIFSLLIYSSPFFRPREYDLLTDSDIIAGKERNEQQVKSLYDYLPQTVKVIPEDYPSYSPTSIRTSNSYQDTIDLTEPTIASLPIFYYPGWKAKVNGLSQDITSHPQSGLITLSLKPGLNNILLHFDNTPLRSFANLLSLLSLALSILYVILNSNGQKHKAH